MTVGGPGPARARAGPAAALSGHGVKPGPIRAWPHWQHATDSEQSRPRLRGSRAASTGPPAARAIMNLKVAGPRARSADSARDLELDPAAAGVTVRRLGPQPGSDSAGGPGVTSHQRTVTSRK